MAIMAPEVAAGGGGLGAALGFGAGKAGDGLGGVGEAGSPAAFMLAIVLIGGALGAFWLAFHNPSEWDLTGGQWPGLAGRALQWAQSKAEGPSLLGALNTSQPAATGPVNVSKAVASGANLMTEEQLPGIGPVFAAGPIISDLKKLLHL